MSDVCLSSDAVASGAAANGETLYIGRRKHDSRNDSDEPLVVSGYITPSEKTLSICWNYEEHYYIGGEDGYEVLVSDQPEIFTQVVYSDGEVPPNTVVGGTDCSKDVYIGRLVTGSDVSTGKTWQSVKQGV